ncbi:unnamed protein product, partial [Musa textilis]
MGFNLDKLLLFLLCVVLLASEGEKVCGLRSVDHVLRYGEKKVDWHRRTDTSLPTSTSSASTPARNQQPSRHHLILTAPANEGFEEGRILSTTG